MATHRGPCLPACLCAASLALLALSGCAGVSKPAEASYYDGSDLARGEAPAPSSAQPADKERAKVAASIATEEAKAPPQAESQPDAAAAPEPGQRLRVYGGYLELVANEVEKTRERIVEAVGKMGGYVETTTPEYVVVRVPAQRFDEAMESFAAMGEVRARSVESTDVTESYADLGRRIEIAKRTRQRLYDLLEKTEDVKERVVILREIRRLTEEIEQLTAALTVMEAQIALSRITVRLTSRIDDAGARSAGIPFPWIAGLSPLRPSARASRAEISLAIPAEYAVFERGKRVRLEAAEGTRVTIGALPNEPRGDADFWRAALLFHVKGLYRSLEEVSAGSFGGAVFESKDIVPFHYLAAVAVRGDEILLVEAFFPDAQARARRLPGLLAMLEEVKP